MLLGLGRRYTIDSTSTYSNRARQYSKAGPEQHNLNVSLLRVVRAHSKQWFHLSMSGLVPLREQYPGVAVTSTRPGAGVVGVSHNTPTRHATKIKIDNFVIISKIIILAKHQNKSRFTTLYTLSDSNKLRVDGSVLK